MGILDAFRETPSERIELRMQNETLAEENRYLNSEITEIKEDLLRISDAFDNIGWAPLPDKDAAEIPLKTVKKVSKVARAMNTMNPFVKRGVEARISYVWGKGVSFDGIEGIQSQINENRKKLFSPQAYAEIERVLATDGNAFTALPIGDKAEENSAFRITINEIEGAISNPVDKEEIWFYKREYTVVTTNSNTGAVTEKTEEKYYASLPYYLKLQKQGKALQKRWNKVGVEQNYIIQHVAVNKQVGWRWGVPDILPVIFWAKAYKEYLEDNAMLVKAYARLAWQVRPTSAAGAQAAAAQVMRPPSRDGMTGELRDVGGTAINGLGGELTPVAATGSSVDFSKGSALASAIASGLEVSKVVITSDPGEGNRATAETLDLPTLKAMESRQLVHTERFLELFEFWGAKVVQDVNMRSSSQEISEAKAEGESTGSGAKFAIVTWPQIESDTTKDRITAIGTSVELGIIYKQEARKEALDVLGIAPFKPWDDLPTMEDDPAAAEQAKLAEDQANAAFEREQSVIAKQGVSGGVTAKGGSQTSSNASRDSRDADKNNS